MAGHHPRREDHRHSDAVRGQLEVQRLRQPEHRELGRLVRAQPARGVEHRRRRGEHEMRVRGPAEQRQERTGHARSADDVDVEHPRPCVVAELLDRAELLHADVREHEVGAAELLLDGDGGRGDLRQSLTSARRPIDRTPCSCASAAASLDTRSASTVEQRHVEAARRAAIAERAPEPGAAAGDDRDAGGRGRCSSWRGDAVEKSVRSRVSVERLDPPAVAVELLVGLVVVAVAVRARVPLGQTQHVLHRPDRRSPSSAT